MASVLKNIGLILIIVLHIKYIQPYPADVLIDEMQEEDDGTIDLSRFGDAIFGDPDESVGRMVDEWTPESGTNAEELGNYFEGDILIPFSEARNGLVKESSRWRNNIIPYVFHSSVSSQDRSLINQAINEYHAKTCLKFVPRSSEKDYISFESSSSGCWSSVGRIGGKQSLNLQSGGCTRIGTIEHEMMHALGFLHEQNRYDRDDFVTVIKQNIKPDTLPNFEKARYGETTAYDVTYDKGSVMHYSPTAFSRNGQKTILSKNGSDGQMGQRNGFARSDLLRINAMYKCDSQISGGGYPSGNTGGNNVSPPRPQPARPKPIQRPGNNAAGALISGLGSFFQALGSG
ncbi:unnamed protein product [Chironomus riparius]|uniref:Metalloendopeptidase n=1 Tax=Chironomus riparius TaxID=315576 RepID=A0A9P0NMA4_9DIPT|nr:unnamed protein product [Chironomus riparius]